MDENDDDFGSISVEGYQIDGQQGCDSLITINHSQISSSELTTLLENDGITTNLQGDYIYKVVINAGGGYATHTEMMMCLDNKTPVSGLAKGMSDNSEVNRTQIGTDPTLENLFEFNNLGWVDVSSYTEASELFLILNSKWGSDIDTWIYYWFGTDQKIEELGYGLLDENDDDFGSISVEGYQIGGSGSMWLAAEPQYGNIAPGESENITVTFNSEGLEIGTYNGEINISSNDPDNSEVQVPVTLNVLEEPTINICGTITNECTGDPISNVTVTFSNGGGEVTTGTDGSYCIEVTSGYNGVATPLKTNHGFTPPTRPYTNVTTNLENEDYEGMPTTNISITGYVKDEEGNPVEGVEISFSGVGTATTNSDGDYSQSVPYCWSGTATPSKEGWAFDPDQLPYSNVTSDQSGQNYTGSQTGDNYFEQVWITPISPMNIYVTKATIDENNMVAGDEIGVFDVDPVSGSEICVGSGVLTGEISDEDYLLIIASMDDGTGNANGFQSGNAILYKLYDQNIGLIETVNSTYPYGGDEVFTGLGTASVELEGITTISQSLNFTEGWNLSSMQVVPEDLDMLSIFEPAISDNLLVKVINQDGGSVEHLSFPPPNGQWSNSIGEWVIEQGYYVKVSETNSMDISGAPAETPMNIPLRSGWNMIGMPCEQPQSTQDMLQPLIDDDILYKVINSQGLSIEHLSFPPPNGQWVFGFDRFNPGEGYYLKANEASQITFDCQSPFNGSKIEIIKTNFFKPVFKNNPYMPMSVVIQNTAILEIGDEVAIHDNETCVGAGVVNEHDFLSIVVSMDDPLTDETDGYMQGGEIQARVWQRSTGCTFEANLDYQSGSPVFEMLDTYIGYLSVQMTGFNETENMEFNVSVAPNPFTENTWIYYTLPESGSIDFRIYSISGSLEEVLEVDSSIGKSGKVKLDGKRLPPGSYILQSVFTGFSGKNQKVQRKLFIK